MKQLMSYSAAVVVLAASVVGYRYLQQPAGTDTGLEAARPAASAERQPVEGVVSDPESPVTGTGVKPFVSDDEVAGETQDALAAAQPSATGVAPTPDRGLSAQPTGTVQYTAPPNPGAASLGEFQQHFRNQLKRMPPEERDAATLSRRMQKEYTSSRSSLAEAVRKSSATK